MGDLLGSSDSAQVKNGSSRKRTLSDVLLNDNDSGEIGNSFHKRKASSSTVSKPICFRKPTGQTVRFVTEKTREAKKIATNPPENGGATAVIGPSRPLDLSSILGGNNGNAVTNSSKTPTPGPTLASMLSSISEEANLCTNEVNNLTCDGEDCRITTSELVPLGCDLSRIEAKMEYLISMVRNYKGFPTVAQTSSLTTQKYSIPAQRFQSYVKPGSSSVSSTVPRFTTVSTMARTMSPAVRYKIANSTTPSTSIAQPTTNRITQSIPSNRVPVPLLDTVRRAQEPPRSTDPNTMVSSLFSQKAQPRVAFTTMTTAKSAAPIPNAKNDLARALLLFPGREFTYGDFCEKSPGIMKGLSRQEIHNVLTELSNNQLLYQEDDDAAMTKRSTLWQKELSKGRLRNLKKYDISLDEYMESFDK